MVVKCQVTLLCLIFDKVILLCLIFDKVILLCLIFDKVIIQINGFSFQKPSHIDSTLLAFNKVILGTAKFHLIPENEEVGQPQDLIQGMECLMASYYVFNLEYLRSVINTLM